MKKAIKTIIQDINTYLFLIVSALILLAIKIGGADGRFLVAFFLLWWLCFGGCVIANLIKTMKK